MTILGQSPAQKVATCIFCCPVSFYIPMWIDEWWALEACCLSYLNCGRCCWTVLSPICFTCKLGDASSAMDYCVEGIKYFFLSWALGIVSCCDGIWNMGNFVARVCKSGATSFDDVALKDAHFIADKIKEAIKVENGNEPLKTLGKYTP